MKKWLSIILAASLLLYPFATFAEDYGSQSSRAQESPPVAQPLVREGDFAIKLAATLDIGTPTDEAVAEDMLAKKGIAPLNGWISDYPVTPQIIGQLHDSIAKAAAEGKLPMTSDEATRGLASLAQQANLPTPAGPGNASNTPQSPAEASNPTVINNYYYDEGPPIVTYYPPPYDYFYLYDWVPYPVWWFGFWFPGFFICHNFTTTVFVSSPFFVNRTTFVSRRAVVSNQVIDPVTRTVFRVDPAARTSAGRTQPVTMLRAPSGRTFTTLTQMRNVVKASGLNAVRGKGGLSMRGTSAAGGFKTLEARKSAQAIYNRSAAGMRYDRGPARSMYRGGERRTNVPGRSYGPPARRGNETVRPYQGQGTPRRSYNYNNYNNAPVRGYQRRYDSPGSFTRPYGGPAIRGIQQSVRPLPGNGWQGGGSYSGRAYGRPWR
jgi:hypothetical protein